MIMSLSTACLYHLPLRATFRLAAEAGFEGIELVPALELWARGPRRVAAMAKEYGLDIYSVHQTILPVSPRGGRSRRIVDAVEIALELGCPCVVIHGPWCLRWGDRNAQRWLRTLESCQTRLKGSGTRLAIENPGSYSDIDMHHVLSPLPLLLSFAGRRDLDITFDTCHAGTAGLDLLDAYALIGDRLKNVHLSDLAMGTRPGGNHAMDTLFSHHQMPGEGVLPLAEFISRLKGDGFQGPLSLEVSPFALRFWSPTQLRQRLAEAVAFVRAIPEKAGV